MAKFYKLSRKQDKSIIGEPIYYRFNEKMQVGTVIKERDGKVLPLFIDNCFGRMLEYMLDTGQLEFIYKNGKVSLVPTNDSD